jgi:hypothetical protein
MRFTPHITSGIKDSQVRQLFEFVFKLFAGLLDYNLYTVTAVWKVPFVLDVPVASGAPRVVSPAVVRVGRAIAVGDEQTPVHTGSVLWTWKGNGQVNIADVAGLVENVKYTLTFEVVSA